MSTLRKGKTGLPMSIWVDDAQAYVDGERGKVVRFQLDTGEANPFFCGEMGLDGEIREPRGPIPGLSASDISALRNFVHNNRVALERLADMEMDVLDVWPFVIKGGRVASEEERAPLAVQVARLVVETKAEG